MSTASAGEQEHFEQTLRGLTPSAANLDRDGLMFAAGAATAQRPGRLWQGAFAAAGLSAVSLGLMLALRPPTVVTETVTRDRIVHVPVTATPATVASHGPVAGEATRPLALEDHHLTPGDLRLRQMRDVILRWGVDAVPRPQVEPESRSLPARPTSAFDRHELLESDGS